MEGLFTIAVLVALAVPIAAIAALIRTGRLEKLFGTNAREQQRAVLRLEDEIESLRQQVSKLNTKLERLTVSEPATAPAEPSVAQPVVSAVVEPAVAFEAPIADVRAAEPVTTAEDREFITISALEGKGEITPEAVAPITEPEPVIIVELPAFATQTGTAGAEAFAEISAVTDTATEPPPLPQASARTRPVQPEYRLSYPQQKSAGERLRSALAFEEILGANWLNKIGVVILVLGIALFGIYELGEMGPTGKVSVLYAVSCALLGAGVYIERKHNYRVIGRAGIGGGWALTFFNTYALHHVQAMHVMPSETLNCVLMLAVAIAMVVHTLRYKSQFVTGLSFLLAFTTIALSQDTVYALSAGAILTIGIVAISLKMGWYELEVFGILSSYLNHLYWLWRIHPDGMAHHAFPEFWSSTIILVLYWLTFRISYVTRRVRENKDEQVSTVAALVNTALLLAVMKFQSTRPELAFYALLALGVMEFFFGQLAPTRRRRAAFILLTTLGTVLIFASVPFKFTGNNIALLWMIAAEVLLIAGIAQKEVVFRRLGLLTGLCTGLLVLYEAWHIVDLRSVSEAPRVQDGVLLLTCGAFFYANALFLGRKWKSLFEGFDAHVLVAHSYIAAVAAFLGCWAVFVQDWTAVAWAVLMLAVALGARYLADNNLAIQVVLLAILAFARAVVTNCHLEAIYPHHMLVRVLTLISLALIFYAAAIITSKVHVILEGLSLTFGSACIALLIWAEIAPNWISACWVAFGVVLALIGRRLKLVTLCCHEHVLVLAATLCLLQLNLDARSGVARYIPFIVCSALLYAISRFCTVRDAFFAQPAAWAHTTLATGLLAVLAWDRAPEVWLAVVWASLALALALFDRVVRTEELPFQVHALAFMSAISAVGCNLQAQGQWHHLSLRFITLTILTLVLYLLTYCLRFPQAIRDRDYHHIYSWMGSFFAAWMLWSELQPVSVAIGLAVFGLILFEYGGLRKITQLRFQAYVALTAAFVRIFLVNLTASPAQGEWIGPRLYTVVPLALIYFFVWAQLQGEKTEAKGERLAIGDIIAYFGTGCIVALMYFQIKPEWIVAPWAALVLLLMASSLVLKRAIFLQQGTLLTIAIVSRSIAHNLFGESYFAAGSWSGRFEVLSITSLLLLATLPFAFRLRGTLDAAEQTRGIRRLFAAISSRPEQLLFFSPVLLITLMILIKMKPGMVTLSWGIEGVLVFLLALVVGQRSYRLTGLALLLLCVGKILLKDAWRLSESDRYITFIVLGAALVLVSFLYSKYRESLRQYL